jgi:hypothetical protein
MSVMVIQSLLCVLIVLWGLAMVIIGMVWANWTWILLGLAVLIVGLPFVWNVFRSTDLQQE